MKIKWDKVKWNSERANREGWDVFDNGDTLEIQRLDDPEGFDPSLGYDDPKFDSDEDATAFVTSRAADGSEYHQLALKLHNAELED